MDIFFPYQIDKDGANPERVMQDLSSIGLMPEDWGGDIPMVQVCFSNLLIFIAYIVCALSVYPFLWTNIIFCHPVLTDQCSQGKQHRWFTRNCYACCWGQLILIGCQLVGIGVFLAICNNIKFSYAWCFIVRFGFLDLIWWLWHLFCIHTVHADPFSRTVYVGMLQGFGIQMHLIQWVEQQKDNQKYIYGQNYLVGATNFLDICSNTYRYCRSLSNHLWKRLPRFKRMQRVSKYLHIETVKLMLVLMLWLI